MNTEINAKVRADSCVANTLNAASRKLAASTYGRGGAYVADLQGQ